MPNRRTDMWQTSVRYLKGVGPKMADQLGKLGVKTIEDLVYHFPFRYEDYTLVKRIGDLKSGETVNIIGNLKDITNSYLKGRRQKSIQKARLEDRTGLIDVIWFNQPYLVNNLKPPVVVSLSGKVGQQGRKIQLVSPQYQIIAHQKEEFDPKEKPDSNNNQLVPIYPTTSKINNRYIRKIIQTALKDTKEEIEEFLPSEIIKREKLLPLSEAIEKIHLPQDKEDIAQARSRLAFDELFLLHLKQLTKRAKWQKKQPAIKIESKEIINQFIKKLTFKLTSAQKSAIDEIILDMQNGTAMNRLLQGDVGSGKTIVATTAALNVIKNNCQVVFMVPTQILAQQHYKNLKKILKPFKIKIGLMISSTKTKEKMVGKDLIIGTHALIHKYAHFKKIGLVIIDEQHRFGVSQRSKLIKKAQLKDKDNFYPHILTMTATPIPRTISLTVYGDLDISVLDQMPPGRKKVKTFLIPNSKRNSCYQWLKEEIKQRNTQAFVVCPLIEESETLESVKAATAEFKKLKSEVFQGLKLSLLHGRMKSTEKEKTLIKMQQGKIDILVATPVVEVGIDIPNANTMIIETANRFGLAQLHQLRGRVGRDKKQSYCFLFASHLSPGASRRIRAMEQTADGMRLAEMDLKLRGPGEVYGLRQHGFPEFRIASFSDLELMQKTRNLALKFIQKDPNLRLHPKLKEKIKERNKIKKIALN